MPYDDPSPTDPTELIGVKLAVSSDAVRDMAYTFAEEFAMNGTPAERILHMFATPFYDAMHQAQRILGEEEIKRIVDESVEFYSHARFVVRDAENQDLVTIGGGTQ